MNYYCVKYGDTINWKIDCKNRFSICLLWWNRFWRVTSNFAMEMLKSLFTQWICMVLNGCLISMINDCWKYNISMDFFFFSFLSRWTLQSTKSVAWWTRSEIFVTCPSLLMSIMVNPLWPIHWYLKPVLLLVLRPVKRVSLIPVRTSRNDASPSNRRESTTLSPFYFFYFQVFFSSFSLSYIHIVGT